MRTARYEGPFDTRASEWIGDLTVWTRQNAGDKFRDWVLGFIRQHFFRRFGRRRRVVRKRFNRRIALHKRLRSRPALPLHRPVESHGAHLQQHKSHEN